MPSTFTFSLNQFLLVWLNCSYSRLYTCNCVWCFQQKGVISVRVRDVGKKWAVEEAFESCYRKCGIHLRLKRCLSKCFVQYEITRDLWKLWEKKRKSFWKLQEHKKNFYGSLFKSTNRNKLCYNLVDLIPITFLNKIRPWRVPAPVVSSNNNNVSGPNVDKEISSRWLIRTRGSFLIGLHNHNFDF